MTTEAAKHDQWMSPVTGSPTHVLDVARQSP
jgi:hypothetical protein